MIVGWIGRLFRTAARLRRPPRGRDLDHVGAELVRLEARRAQRAASASR